VKRGRGGAVIALSIVAIVLLVVVVRVIIDTLQYSQSASGDPAQALPSATTTRSPPQTRLAVTGRGDHTTGQFTVGGAWRLAWRVDCSRASFRLLVIASKPVDSRNKDADLPGVFQQTYMKGATNWRSHGTGESRRSGTFRLLIGTPCAWRVRVTDS
jgi:hypothetical protein